MTPFGAKVRALRRHRGIPLTRMAQDLGVSAAYLSALEHGRRGRPTPGLVMQVCGYFDLIWDEAEDLKHLARLSHPRVVIDTAGLNPEATELANLLGECIAGLDIGTLAAALALIRGETDVDPAGPATPAAGRRRPIVPNEATG
ncbi:MAG: XRE family transcriptional regulator [Rhodospirillales bacterium]|nr:MAG: XRE family transcriptional regulator [Rhodospirillales bacterium]